MKHPRRPLVPAVVLLCSLFSYSQQAPVVPHGSPSHAVDQGTVIAAYSTAPGAQKYVPGQLLVRFRHGVSKQAARAEHASVGATVLQEFHIVENLQLIRLPAGMHIKDGKRFYRARPDVLYAEPNYIRHTAQFPITPNDPQYAQMWNLHNSGQSGGKPGADIRAAEAWSVTTGSSKVVIGVTDTGIDYNHADLTANMYRNAPDCNSNGIDDDGNGYVDDCYGIDTANNDSDPMDDAGHGTHVAGTIGAVGNNGVGVVGVNWQVQLMACKFLDAFGWGTSAGAIACLQYFAMMKDRGVNLVVTNNSWGGGLSSQAEMDAIDSHRQRGILFVAAAGNDGADVDLLSFYPARYDLPNVIAVAATDRMDALAMFSVIGSNFGRHTIHLGAPGKEILSTFPGARYATGSGTSMAAPHVTGVAALLKAQDPTRDWKAIKNLILAGGDTVPALANTITSKRLNAYGALTCSNSVVQFRLRPMYDDVYVLAGDSLALRVLNIRCAAPNGVVEVRIDGGRDTMYLVDDGIEPDVEANDGIYVGQRQWLASEIGDHTLTLPNNDVLVVHVVPPLAAYTYSMDVGFNYRDIEGTDLHIGDPGTAVIRPPFPVQFGGASFPTLNVNGYGNITFFGPSVEWDDSPLPTTITPAMVAPFWDALVIYPGSVRWAVNGAAPNRELVIEWRHVSQFDCFELYDTAVGTFQVVFFEDSSDILFNYADVEFGPFNPIDGPCFDSVNEGGSATVGVQSTSNLANQFSFGTRSLRNQTSILWQVGEPTPFITQLSPLSALAGAPQLSLQVTGRSFAPGSVVRWNGSDRPTTYVHAGALTAIIPASDLANACTAQVTVAAPSGHQSPAVPFNAYSSYPVPTLTGISPNPFSADGMMLTLTGTNFVSNSTVRWNGADRSLSDWFGAVISSTQIEMKPLDIDTWSAGAAQVSIFNPAPGGGTSNTLTLNIINPVPLLTGISPASVGAGGPAFTLEVFGYNFTQASVIRWNGNDRPTTPAPPPNHRFYLSATIPATDIASLGKAQVSVFTPTPGGGLSESRTLSVVEPRPGFNITADPTAKTVSRGTPASYTIRITPQFGSFNDPIALSCQVAPAGPTCSLSELSVTPGVAPVSVTLTVATTNVARMVNPSRSAPVFAIWLALPVFGLLATRSFWPVARKAKLSIFLAVVLIIVSVGMQTACGGGGGGSGSGETKPPPSETRSFSITVIGTSGTVIQQTTAYLNVTF